jgi:hypothetical protein
VESGGVLWRQAAKQINFIITLKPYINMLQAGRSRVRDPMRSMKFFNLPNPSGRIRTWGSLSL